MLSIRKYGERFLTVLNPLLITMLPASRWLVIK